MKIPPEGLKLGLLHTEFRNLNSELAGLELHDRTNSRVPELLRERNEKALQLKSIGFDVTTQLYRFAFKKELYEVLGSLTKT